MNIWLETFPVTSVSFIFLGTRLRISRKFYRPSAWDQFIHHQASPNLHMAFKSAPAGVRTVTLLRRLNMALGLCPTERTRSASKINIQSYLTTISIKDGIPPAKTTSEFQIRSPLLKTFKDSSSPLVFFPSRVLWECKRDSAANACQPRRSVKTESTIAHVQPHI